MKISNLLISVNGSGCTNHTTLHAAYKELENVVNEKGLEKPIVIIADGHKSPFDAKIMRFCEDASMDQFQLPPDTSGITQLHNQVNNKLHKQYEEKKDEIYSGYCDINKEGFMAILGEIWEEWVTPDQLIKAGKRVGLSVDGLNANWMYQRKFKTAEAILHPPNSTPETSNNLNSTFLLRSLEGVRKGSAEYYRWKLKQSLEHIAQLSETTPELENVPDLMPFKRIAPTKSKNKTLTKMHGSLKSTEVRKLVEEREKSEETERRRKEKHLKKGEMKGAFQRCKLKCLWGKGM